MHLERAIGDAVALIEVELFGGMGSWLLIAPPLKRLALNSRAQRNRMSAPVTAWRRASDADPPRDYRPSIAKEILTLSR